MSSILGAATLVALSVVLLIAGASKLFVPNGLSKSLQEVLNLPEKLSRIVAKAVACSELMASVVLLYSTLLVAAVLTALVGSVIFLYSIRSIVIGARQSCGCFGSSSGRPPGARNLVFALLLLAIAAAMYMGVLPIATNPQPRTSTYLLVSALTITNLAVLTVNSRSIRTALGRAFGSGLQG